MSQMFLSILRPVLDATYHCLGPFHQRHHRVCKMEVFCSCISEEENLWTRGRTRQGQLQRRAEVGVSPASGFINNNENNSKLIWVSLKEHTEPAHLEPRQGQLMVIPSGSGRHVAQPSLEDVGVCGRHKGAEVCPRSDGQKQTRQNNCL